MLEISNLNVEYKSDKKVVKAVNDLSLDIKKGEILAIAGESGCGKSTLAKAIAKLVDIESGNISFYGVNVSDLKEKKLKLYRQSVQVIFQNPYSSLNPKMKIGEILKEPLLINKNITTYSDDNTPISEFSTKAIDVIVEKILEQVGLDKDVLNRYPHEFSGGQRQRIAIARALIMKPELIIADEPVSALDVSIQAQIINLLLALKNEFNLTMLFISHDLSVIRHISDRIAIMYLGEIVEIGSSGKIFDNPQHPYTQALLNAVPKLYKKVNATTLLKGDLPSPTNLPEGCKFHTRCPYAMEKCRKESPKIMQTAYEHQVACFLMHKSI